MGKSSASCFKFIACGGDSVDHDDLQVSEIKDSSDRRGWSFRKRSARHRVLSNTVISEAPSSTNKENTDTAAINFLVQPDSNVPEKTLVNNGTDTEDMDELYPQLDSKFSDTVAAKEDECEDATYNESSIVIIQAAVRGLLAQQALLKQKNIIKLQAAVRGHIVRRYAVGTLHCVRAIIKMQALVRARHARLAAEEFREDKNDSALLRKKNAKPNGTYTYVSIEKLQNNAFARQLMESSPRPKNIKCEPSKSDTAWKWLERWMSVSAATNKVPLESESAAEQLTEEHSNGRESISPPSESYTEPTDSGSCMAASIESSKNDDCLINYDANISEPHPVALLSPFTHPKLHSIAPTNSSFDVTESGNIDFRGTDAVEEIQGKSFPKEEEISEPDGPNSKKFPTEKAETEAKKISRKASNPAFIAAQSKFEELSSAVAPVMLSESSIHDPRVESSLDKISSATDILLISRDDGLADNSFSNNSAVQIGDSECGTVLSITSTLDSPERSEAGVSHVEQDTKVSDETSHHRSREGLELEANGNWSCSNSIKMEPEESIDSGAGEYLNSMTAVDSPQPEANLQVTLGYEESPTPDTSSPKASSRSHITVPISQAKPSSQVSVKSKKNKGEKSGSNRNTKSSSADKNSLSNGTQDAAASKSSLDHKTGKKRHSVGSEKPDHKEHELRDGSNNNNSNLPSYMQVTQSARAKALANGSPRSSPDAHDKETHVKKRHSVPGLSERQTSPRVQRPVSQAQVQNAKGNGILSSPQERKWRR